MEDDFNDFWRSLIKAGLRIDRHYFQLSIAGSDEPIFRERVYCYELYHQLRCILGDRFPYKLDGEVDKSGHHYSNKALDSKKPDFIVHVPGEMKRNLVVIEVKPVTVKDRMSELEKDLKKLKGFIDRAKYQRAIMLIYGADGDDLPANFRIEIKRLRNKYSERILFVHHPGPGKEPVIVQ